jgi:hypothetical protein
MDAWLNRLRREIEDTTRGLQDKDWERAPEGRWSSAQIMEHLGRSYGSTAKMLESALSAAAADAPNAPQLRAATPYERLAKFVVINLRIFPAGHKAPDFVSPQGDTGPVALRRALTDLERMDTAIEEAEQRWGGRDAIALHFALGPMNPSQWRKFHYLHGHHHLRQVRERLAGHGAPQ